MGWFLKLRLTLTCFFGVLLVIPFPKLDRSRVRGNKDGTAQEGGQRGVEDGGEKSLKQQHGRVWTHTPVQEGNKASIDALLHTNAHT